MMPRKPRAGRSTVSRSIKNLERFQVVWAIATKTAAPFISDIEHLRLVCKYKN
jgi:hypothetical protein